MSLWTPSGEHPVDRPGRASGSPRPTGAERASAPPGPGAPEPEDLSPEEREQVEAYAQQVEEAHQRLLEMPAGPVVGQQALQFYELAALHMSQPEPRLDDARIAIDALAAVVDALGPRLGEAHEPLTQALHQLRLAFVEASGPSSGSGSSAPAAG